MLKSKPETKVPGLQKTEIRVPKCTKNFTREPALDD